MLTGGMARTFGQQSQSLTFANTNFDYQPHQSSACKPVIGVFVGAEYSLRPPWSWQFGLAIYQNACSSTSGEEFQAPLLSLDSVNVWDYKYKISSRQILFENKLLFILKKHFHPYLLAGFGESFNRTDDFQVTPQNPGEVATVIYSSNNNRNFAYKLGLGGDLDLGEHTRIGIGYRFAYLGKADFGKGMLDTGIGGSVFSLPALKSIPYYNHEILIQLTYLFHK